MREILWWYDDSMMIRSFVIHILDFIWELNSWTRTEPTKNYLKQKFLYSKIISSLSVAMRDVRHQIHAYYREMSTSAIILMCFVTSVLLEHKYIHMHAENNIKGIWKTNTNVNFNKIKKNSLCSSLSCALNIFFDISSFCVW